MNRAVALLAEAKGPGRGRATVTPLRTLGPHPDDQQPVEVYSGRYGPYVKHGKINATLSKNLTPEDVTLEQALPLLAARAAAGGGKKPARGRAAAARKKMAAPVTEMKPAAKAKKKAVPKSRKAPTKDAA